MTLTFGSLFAGVGGFDLGLERAGLRCLWQVEIDAKCRQVLARHWPDVTRWEDVRDVGRHNLEPADVICGGFPCQDVSVAGRRKGLAGERSGLWHEFHRILAECRPRWAIIENVPGLLSSNQGRDFAIILYGLVKLGYGVCWRVLDAQFAGVAQRRRRVFIVGHLGDGRAAQVLFERTSRAWDTPPSREAGTGVAKPLASGTHGSRRDLDHGAYVPVGTFQNTGHGWWNESPVGQTIRTPEGGGSLEANVVAFSRHDDGRVATVNLSPTMRVGSSLQGGTTTGNVAIAFQPRYARNGRGAPDTIVPPLTAEAGRTGKGDSATCVAFDWQSGGDVRLNISEHHTSALSSSQVPAVMRYGVRRLTPTECCRLQGFPDDWNDGQSDSARYRQLGNAVAVPCAQWLGRRILEAL